MTEEIAEALFEAGCDDGSPCSGLGVAKVRFYREAPSLEHALASAVSNVRAAGLRVAHVQIDEEELSELAQRKLNARVIDTRVEDDVQWHDSS